MQGRNLNVGVGTNLDVEMKQDNSDKMVINVVGNAHLLVEGYALSHQRKSLWIL